MKKWTDTNFVRRLSDAPQNRLSISANEDDDVHFTHMYAPTDRIDMRNPRANKAMLLAIGESMKFHLNYLMNGENNLDTKAINCDKYHRRNMHAHTYPRPEKQSFEWSHKAPKNVNLLRSTGGDSPSTCKSTFFSSSPVFRCFAYFFSHGSFFLLVAAFFQEFPRRPQKPIKIKKTWTLGGEKRECKVENFFFNFFNIPLDSDYRRWINENIVNAY